MISPLKKVGKNYDHDVKEWRDCIIAELDASDGGVSCHEQYLYTKYITLLTDNLFLGSKLTVHDLIRTVLLST